MSNPLLRLHPPYRVELASSHGCHHPHPKLLILLPYQLTVLPAALFLVHVFVDVVVDFGVVWWGLRTSYQVLDHHHHDDCHLHPHHKVLWLNVCCSIPAVLLLS